MPVRLDGGRIGLQAFLKAVAQPGPVEIAPAVVARLEAGRAAVDAALAGEAPVYGLNTGLGANLGHRLALDEVAAFQVQLLSGRAVAVGEPLAEPVGRAAVLARLISAGQGVSGLSPPLFAHMASVFAAGLSPVVPRYGSLGAGDLTQNARIGLALIGRGEMWRAGEVAAADRALVEAGLAPPILLPKDAMALVNHSGMTVALAARALGEALACRDMARVAAVLSYEGYGANRQVLAEEVNALRPAQGQAEAARWFREALAGAEEAPRRVQEALSFRTLAPVMGALDHALAGAVAVLEDELNGAPDSPAVMADGRLVSTANFHTPALALAMEGLSLALAMAGHASLQRQQRLMEPERSGLPRYLSPQGGAAAGFVPAQKTAAALMAEIRHGALPVAFDPTPVSEAVEDVAPMTPAVALKLSRQVAPFRLLIGLEALVAAQALDLRQTAKGSPLRTSALTRRVWEALRAQIPVLAEDRPLGREIEVAAGVLERQTLECL